MSDSEDRFDVGAFIAGRPLGLFHVLIVALITIVMMVDGYDLLFIGNVLPAVSKGFGIAPSGLAGVLMMQALAIGVGGFLLSVLSDKFGRKTVLLVSVFGFGAATTVSGLCTGVPQFALTRVVAGLFLGGVVPNAIPIVSEYAPSKFKATLVTLSFVGLSLGGVIGVLASAELATRYGWQSAFLVAGAAPVIVALVCLLALPESLAFRVLRNPADARIPAMLRRLDRRLQLTGSESFHVDDAGSKAKSADTKFSAFDLFREGRAVSTLCVWAIFGLSLVSAGLASTWSATILVSKRGLTLVQAGHYTGLLVASSIVATLVYGWLLDRFGYLKVLAISYVLAIVSMLSLAFEPWNSVPQIVSTIINGATALSAQNGLIALVPLLYPTKMKATGLGWAWSFGRSLALIAPLLGGYLVARNISFLGFALTVSAPWAMIIVLLAILGRERRRLDARAAGAR